MKRYLITWVTGETLIVVGETFESALKAKGFNDEIFELIDHYEEI